MQKAKGERPDCVEQKRRLKIIQITTLSIRDEQKSTCEATTAAGHISQEQESVSRLGTGPKVVR